MEIKTLAQTILKPLTNIFSSKSNPKEDSANKNVDKKKTTTDPTSPQNKNKDDNNPPDSIYTLW
jgi:hypothetical protein